MDLRGPFYISLYNVKPVSHDKAYVCARPLKVRGPRQKPMLPMPKTASALVNNLECHCSTNVTTYSM
jgi:hypothetical protein